MRSRLRAAWITTKLAFRADRVAGCAAVVLFSAQGVLGTLMTVLMASIVAAVVHLDPHAALVAVVEYVIADTLVSSVSVAMLDLRFRLTEKTGLLIEQELITAMTSAPGLDLHERPANLDRIEVLRKQTAALSNTVGALLHNLSLFTGFGSMIAILASVHPLLALLPLAGLPALVCSARWINAYQRAMDGTAERQRRADHLFFLATTPGPAKELRTFGLGREVIARHRDLLGSAHRDLDDVSMWWGVATGIAWGALGLAKVAAIGFAAWLGTRGDITLAAVILTVSLTGAIDGYLQQLNDMVSWLFSSLRTAERYVSVLDDARALQLAEIPWEPAPAPATLQRGIELDRVGFRYPDTDTDVLHDVSLVLPAGATVAIVGENGAGKSTLVKLLGRYYTASSGTIRVDGTDLARIDVAAWRARVSGAFQDHARFELVAREVVGVGDLSRAHDVDAVTDALARAGGHELPARLDHGLDTPLGKSFDDGIEPSGGQWQQLSLGRALLRDAPLLLLLDEPTSALDPDAEHALFAGYASAARAAAKETGAITLLVSHRFSTVRMADLIVVLEHGTVAQAGTHDELIAAGGTYAELYELQARAYQ